MEGRQLGIGLVSVQAEVIQSIQYRLEFWQKQAGFGRAKERQGNVM